MHGWPLLGFFYDVSVFQVDVKDRIESLQLTDIPGEAIDINTGNTRNRGVEAEGDYDLLRVWDAPEAQHLSVFVNASYLDARFTSVITAADAGKIPAYAPGYVLKAGVTLRRDNVYKFSLVVDSVGHQYFQDSDQPIVSAAGTTPALIPSYTVADLAGDYTIAGHLRLLAGILPVSAAVITLVKRASR